MSTDANLQHIERLVAEPQSPAEEIVMALERFAGAIQQDLEQSKLSPNDVLGLQARIQELLLSVTSQQVEISQTLRGVANRLKAQAAYGVKK